MEIMGAPRSIEGAAKMGCQLRETGAIGRESWRRYLGRQGRKFETGVRSVRRYVVNHTRSAFRRLGRNLEQTRGANESFTTGTRVRVRTREAIEATLDVRRRCCGCPFAEPMFRHCEQEYRVAKQVRFFFDETCRRLVRCRNIVLLEGVYCDGTGYPESGGCDRTCFFFWHTEWLERVE
jgi:hypothetical protein